LKSGESTTTTRDALATQIPSGIPHPVPAGTRVRLTQSLGGSYTVMTDQGYMVRFDAKDADVLGISPEEAQAQVPTEFSDKLVWDRLRTVYDPEIPVNVVDLGLIYDCQIVPMDNAHQIEITMTITPPRCGMADVLKADIPRPLAILRTATQVNVEVVFEPPWHPGRMSEGARLQLGLDLDSSPFQMYGRY